MPEELDEVKGCCKHQPNTAFWPCSKGKHPQTPTWKIIHEEQLFPVVCNLKGLSLAMLHLLSGSHSGHSPKAQLSHSTGKADEKCCFSMIQTPGRMGTSSNSCGQGGKNLPWCHFAFPLKWSQCPDQSQPRASLASSYPLGHVLVQL